MKRKFSFWDAGRLERRHRELRRGAERAQSALEAYCQAIRDAAERYAAAEVLKLMRDVPVEELYREKKGIRVKALKDSGIVCFADILTASVHQLTAIRGIGEENAGMLKKMAEEAAGAAKKATKLRLSADQRTEDTTRLVRAVSQYRAAKEIGVSYAELLGSRGYEILSAMEDLRAAAGPLRWLFASAEKRQRAIGAYGFLQEELDGEYGKKAFSLSEELKKLEHLSGGDAWEEFQREPIRCANTLEELMPELFGSDSAWGLSEDLAREIQDECFFPDGLLCELRRYQEWGVKYILHQGKVLLGDEMGLGKTVQAIAAMVSLKNTGATHFAVVCPASVLINWCREIQKFSRLRAIKVHGAGRGEALKEWIGAGGVAVTTYETTAYFDLPKSFQFTLLVVDEAHYIKNPEAKRSVHTRAVAGHAERLLFMTGTALENNVDEMIRLIEVLQPDVARRIEGMKMFSSAPRFRESVAQVYCRRRREDVLAELPELLEHQEWCRLGAEEERAYESAVLRRDYNGARRVSWSAEDLRASGKANRMLEIIEEARSENRKVIVFSFYLDTIRKVAALLGSRCTEPVNGSVSPARRQEIVDGFNRAPAGQVLAAQIVAGGTGLNIQSASVVILCEPQLKPSIENQAISRAYRMGQARNVLVYRLLCEDTIDEKISELLAEKQAVFDAFADQSVAAQNAEIDTKSLGNLIQEEIDRINAKRKKE